MATPTRSAKHSEVLVLGSGLSGLLTAEAYRQAGRQVTLLEASDRSGGTHRPLTTPLGSLPPDLGFLPNIAGAEARLLWLGHLLRLDLNPVAIELGPLHFDEGLMRPFVGFGDRTFGSRDEVDFYTAPQRFETSLSLTDVTLSLTQSLAPFALTRKQVTKLIVQEKRLAAVEVNGEETWTADTVVATQSPSELLELLPIDAIEGRHRTRLAKASVWGSVSLHLLHKHPVAMERGVHVLYGSGQESEPVLGRFWPTQENGQQISVWLTLVPQESNEDTDYMGHALKHLKRQLKRAYPHVLEDLAEEKLVVLSESHGHVELKTKNPLCLPEIENLILANPLFSQFRGPLAAVDVAMKIAAPELEQSPTAQTLLHSPPVT
ncbi:MAG: NAD(P)-binding protein [Bdellovibrionales bacterium]